MSSDGDVTETKASEAGDTEASLFISGAKDLGDVLLTVEGSEGSDAVDSEAEEAGKVEDILGINSGVSSTIYPGKRE
jgi:hypothetical protein